MHRQHVSCQHAHGGPCHQPAHPTSLPVLSTWQVLGGCNHDRLSSSCIGISIQGNVNTALSSSSAWLLCRCALQPRRRKSPMKTRTHPTRLSSGATSASVLCTAKLMIGCSTAAARCSHTRASTGTAGPVCSAPRPHEGLHRLRCSQSDRKCLARVEPPNVGVHCTVLCFSVIQIRGLWF